MENPKEVRCEHCKKVFSDKIKLNFHKLASKPRIKDPCVICETEVPDCVSRQMHLNSHFACFYCKIHFKSSNKLTLHKIVFHSKELPVDLLMQDHEGDFRCFLCDLKFDDPWLGEIHIKTSHLVVSTVLYLLS